MKKTSSSFFLSLGLIAFLPLLGKEIFDTLITLKDADRFTADVIHEMETAPVSFAHLSGWSKARCLGASALGAFAGNMVGYALGNLVGEYRQPKVLHPSEWGYFVTAATLAGLLGGIFYVHTTEYPSGIAKNLDAKLVSLIIKNRETSAESLVQDLNLYFALSKFPRVSAFLALEKLHKNLTYVSELFNDLEKHSYNNQSDLFSYKIELIIDAVKAAMVTLKQDPHWLEEWSAHAVTLAQQNIESHQQGQLASAIIQMAHNK